MYAHEYTKKHADFGNTLELGPTRLLWSLDGRVGSGELLEYGDIAPWAIWHAATYGTDSARIERTDKHGTRQFKMVSTCDDDPLRIGMDPVGICKGDIDWWDVTERPNVAIEGPEQAQLANGPARMESSTT